MPIIYDGKTGERINLPRATSTRPRDSQRGKVYTSEAVILATSQWNGRRLMRSPDHFETIEDCQAYVNQVMARAWFTRRWPHKGSIRVYPGTGSSRARAIGTHRINLPDWSRQPAVILHEMAHCVAKFAHSDKIAGHGPEFVATYLTLVRYALGADAHRRLLASFKANKVRVRPKRILSPAALAQAVERGRALAAGRRAAASPPPPEPTPAVRRVDLDLAIARGNQA